MDDFLGELLDRIDTAGRTFAETGFEAMSDDVVPLFRAMFVLFVMFYGLQLIMGTAKISVSDIVLRIVRALFILILISSWGNFATLIYDWISSVPEAAGRAILAATGTGITEPTNGLSEIWKTANEAAAKFSEQSGFFSVLPALVGFFIMFVCGLFIAVALAILILAKVFLWILVATAPIFIALWLFEATRNFGQGWLSQLIVYSIIPLFIYALAAFIITAASTEITAIEAKIQSASLTLGDFAPFILICFAGAFVMLQIQTLASGIAGTVSSAVGAFGVGLTAAGINVGRRAVGGALRGAGNVARNNLDSQRYAMGQLGTNKGQRIMETSQRNAMEARFRAQQSQ